MAELDLERFAGVMAEVDGGRDLAIVLAREGIAPQAWSLAEETWLARVAAEAEQKRFELTRRYNAAFAARRRQVEPRARTSQPPRAMASEAPGPLQDEAIAAAKEAPQAASPQVEIAPPAPQVELPSFMRAAAAHAPSAPLAPPPAASPAPFVGPAPPPHDAPAPHLGATLGVTAVGGAAGPALPFRTAPALPRLTLEQFASLTAELALARRPHAETTARYGLSEAAHHEESVLWQQRFAAYPADHARFVALCQHYRGWLEQQRGRGDR